MHLYDRLRRVAEPGGAVTAALQGSVTGAA